MGHEIERVALSRGHRIAAAVHPHAEPPERRSVTPSSVAGADVALEFTRPEAAAGNVRALLQCGCRWIVVGTTGWKGRLGEVAGLVEGARGGLVHADNFSIGMAIFSRLVQRAAELLAPAGYDPYVLEWHHAEKRDAPSGTARALASVVEQAAGRRSHEGEVS